MGKRRRTDNNKEMDPDLRKTLRDREAAWAKSREVWLSETSAKLNSELERHKLGFSAGSRLDTFTTFSGMMASKLDNSPKPMATSSPDPNTMVWSPGQP